MKCLRYVSGCLAVVLSLLAIFLLLDPDRCVSIVKEVKCYASGTNPRDESFRENRAFLRTNSEVADDSAPPAAATSIPPPPTSTLSSRNNHSQYQGDLTPPLSIPSYPRMASAKQLPTYPVPDSRQSRRIPSSPPLLRLSVSHHKRRVPSQHLNHVPTLGFESSILKEHNIRRQHSGLAPLHWNSELADKATKWTIEKSKFCDLGHSSTQSRSGHMFFGHIGENIFIRWGNHNNLPGPTASQIASSWFNEKYCYRYGPYGSEDTKIFDEACARNTSFKSLGQVQVGHFTQMLWSKTTHLGCAMRRCAVHSNTKDGFVSVCHYGSALDHLAGNVRNELPFDETVSANLGLKMSASYRRARSR